MVKVKASHPFRKFLILATGVISSLTLSSSFSITTSGVAIAQKESPNLLQNASFEQGLQSWDGSASATGLPKLHN